MNVTILARSPHAGWLAIAIATLSALVGFSLAMVLGEWVLPIAVVIGGAFVIGALWPLPVRVGSDGIVLPGLGRGAFVAFTDVDTFEDDALHTVLRTTGGRQVELVGPDQKKLPERIVAELRDVIARCWSGGETAVLFPPNQGEDMAAWLETLRRTRASDRPECRERLVAFAEDPAVPPLLRAAAALLLRNALAPEERARLARVATTTAVVKLERALHVITSEHAPEAALLSALERLGPRRSVPGRIRRWAEELTRTAAIDLGPVARVVELGVKRVRPYDRTRPLRADSAFGYREAMEKPRVELDTSHGRIVIELAEDAAPKTVANFLAYVDGGHYDGTIFHRVIPGFMIQGGGYDASLDKKPTRAPVENEAHNGLRNRRGTVAMARTSDPHSATAQFFVNVADNVSLDHRDRTERGFGYTVFGHVVSGMEVADAIVAVPTGAKGPFSKDAPLDSVVIRSARRAG